MGRILIETKSNNNNGNNGYMSRVNGPINTSSKTVSGGFSFDTTSSISRDKDSNQDSVIQEFENAILSTG